MTDPMPLDDTEEFTDILTPLGVIRLFAVGNHLTSLGAAPEEHSMHPSPDPSPCCTKLGRRSKRGLRDSCHTLTCRWPRPPPRCRTSYAGFFWLCPSAAHARTKRWRRRWVPPRAPSAAHVGAIRCRLLSPAIALSPHRANWGLLRIQRAGDEDVASCV